MSEPSKYVSKDYVITGSLIDLADKDRVWEAIDKNVRTSVRKGERMGVDIHPFDGSKEELHALAAFTPNDDDIPPVWEDRHHAYVAVAQDTGERLGWILLAGIPGTKKVFMLCHASTPEGKRRQTPNLLLWHVIKTLAGGPYRYLDVGASYRPSLQKYFSQFRQLSYPMIMRPPDVGMKLRMTPFDSAAYGIPSGDPESGRQLLSKAFGTDEFTVFPNDSLAIAAYLRELREEGKLSLDREVCLAADAAPSSVPPGVVTAIDGMCKRTQEPSERTAVVVLVHEFGFPNPRAAELAAFCRERGIPLAEYFPHGWGSEGTGSWGDIRIYSASAHLPLQFGAFLVGMKIPFDRMWNFHASSDLQKEDGVLADVHAHWREAGDIRSERQRVWNRYRDNLASVVEPLFDLTPGDAPGAFLAKLGSVEEAERVAAFVRRFGIDVFTWMDRAALILPCHQRMADRHVDYVCGAILANFREGCGVPRAG
jgi:hypothetical protein